jgi:hypothetical protein
MTQRKQRSVTEIFPSHASTKMINKTNTKEARSIQKQEEGPDCCENKYSTVSVQIIWIIRTHRHTGYFFPNKWEKKKMCKK